MKYPLSLWLSIFVWWAIAAIGKIFTSEYPQRMQRKKVAAGMPLI